MLLGAFTAICLKRRKKAGQNLLDIINMSEFTNDHNITLREIILPINQIIISVMLLVAVFWLLEILTLPLIGFFKESYFFPFVFE